MESISAGIGSGAVHECEISHCINEPWCDFLSVNVKLNTSNVFKDSIEWKCTQGICSSTMKLLNDEFNFFRGLFPLKVFITGPPCSGKTFFASKLSEQYGIPHLTIQEVIDMALKLQNDFGK
jgi:adenylate kinase